MEKNYWWGGRQGSCPPNFEQSTSEEDAPSTPTPPETPPILNDDLQPFATVSGVDPTTSKTSSNVFSQPLSCSFRRVRSWSKKRSGHQEDNNKTKSPRPMSADTVQQPTGQTMKKSTSLVELKTLYRKFQRQFTAGVFGV